MTRPSTPWPTLESRIASRMAPAEAKRPHVLVQWLWAYVTFLTGLGIGLAGIVVLMMAPVIWAVRMVRRAGK